MFSFIDNISVLDLVLKDIREKSYRFVFKRVGVWYSFWLPKFVVKTKIDESMISKLLPYKIQWVKGFNVQIYNSTTKENKDMDLAEFLENFVETETIKMEKR